MSRRVVIVGGESTGTTTLTRALAAHYRARGGPFAGTPWVPEVGRDYTFEKLDALRAVRPEAGMEHLVWTSEDFVAIARRQTELENAEAASGAPVLFCDTDAMATGLWHERYLGRPCPEVDAIAAPLPRELYLLTHHADVPFEPDAIRDGEHLRPWMTERFLEVLQAGSVPFEVLRGPHEERLARAIGRVDALLATPPQLRRI